MKDLVLLLFVSFMGALILISLGMFIIEAAEHLTQ